MTKICTSCSARVGSDAVACPNCGARYRRDYRGLVSGPAFLLVAAAVAPESLPFALLIGGLGAYGLWTLRNFRWVPPKR